MPFAGDEVRLDLLRCAGPGGSRHCVTEIHVHPDALRRLGLHPEQPTARVTGPAPPAWWHAEAERLARRGAI
ncbi:hypothetical protein [Streptomyces sp. UH6]|uniref:hypothetical protein n=1 Tax=Streptomyces sp. UH6 TaxID=2748379 RepID=UPI0015D4A471|nr:hypothetical protein [Streptomyces sp. UH6]NYV77511.1 hypothetical protein [Streptomyces sp. UH6]